MREQMNADPENTMSTHPLSSSKKQIFANQGWNIILMLLSPLGILTFCTGSRNERNGRRFKLISSASGTV